MWLTVTSTVCHGYFRGAEHIPNYFFHFDAPDFQNGDRSPMRTSVPGLHVDIRHSKATNRVISYGLRLDLHAGI